MIASRILSISLGLTLCSALPLPAAESLPASGRRPLPHPDILTLPPETPSGPATHSSSQAQAVNPDPDVDASGGRRDAALNSAEDREIARRLDPGQMLGDESRTLPRRDSAANRSLLRDLWPLLAVLTLIAAAAYALKRFMPSRRLMGGSGVLQILAQTPVTSKQQLMLVKLGGRLVLLGVSPDRMNTLTMIDDPEQVARVLGEVAGTHPRSMNRAFVESMQEEADAYVELPEEDATSATRGQVRGLLKKVRTLAGKTD
jgi:flagellar biosynthetic protein FliO